MASQNKTPSPPDDRNERRNEYKDLVAHLQGHHIDQLQRILLLPDTAPAQRYINSSTNQWWINSYKHNAET